MGRFLHSIGIPNEEIKRVLDSYFNYPDPEFSDNWGAVTGVDNAGTQPRYRIPDTGSPPKPMPENATQTEPYPTMNPPRIESPTWTHDASKLNSNPSMHNEEGWLGQQATPPWRYPIEESQIKIPSLQMQEVSGNDFIKKKKKSLLSKMSPWLALLGGISGVHSIIDSYMKDAEQDSLAPDFTDSVDVPPETKLDDFYKREPLRLLAKYVKNPLHDNKKKDICDDYAGRIFNLLDNGDRPILPSENLGYTTTHPNCGCKWEMVVTGDAPSTLNRSEQSITDNIKGHITKAANKHELHTVKKDGKLSSRTRGTNPLKETIAKIREQFDWLDNDYLKNIKKAADEVDGKIYLIRAATETITDHRVEGDTLRRKLSGNELNAMARTAVGCKMDINHNPDYTTDAVIMDSEYDPDRKEIQMIILEKDSEINRLIADHKITAVSINGGYPRKQLVEPCVDDCKNDNCEMCNVPTGVILGEMDDIGMTWVVTANEGIYWRGDKIEGAKPGIQNTAIESL